MTQYIDKSAVIAEIERLHKEWRWYSSTEAKYRCEAYRELSEFLNTLEVKEVDLRKELNDFIEQQKAWIRDDRVVEYNNGDSFNHIYDLEEIAKHFFELGLKAQKEE